MPSKTKQRAKSTKAGKKGKEPKIIVFACSRTVERCISSDRMGLDVGSEVPVVPVMCSGRLSAGILLSAFESGADGVLVAGCNPEECRFGFGARHGVETVARTQKILELMGYARDKVRFSGGRDLEEAFADYSKHLKNLGRKR